ncbi:2,3-bisphosphoglycerate-dependent phosphoglycerate mutase [uncultured archaeon]|nr:2,3-bisphosphoglycerate-dependent phosphoglycerate mutase [uncultured archaeon]
MVKYNIYLFRHGQTYFNKNKMFTGWKNSSLTPLGVRQAKALGIGLKGKKIDFAFDNSLGRSKQTLKEVLRYHPECKKVITDKRMIERSYGKLEGKHHDEIIKKYGEEQFNLWHRGFNNRPPGGESFADVEIRVKSFVSDLRKLVKSEKVNVAISASGNSIRLFRKIFEKKSGDEAVKWTIHYDTIFHYTIEA